MIRVAESQVPARLSEPETAFYLVPRGLVCTEALEKPSCWQDPCQCPASKHGVEMISATMQMPALLVPTLSLTAAPVVTTLHPFVAMSTRR